MFKSQSQRRKFHADPKLRKYVPEFEAATPKGAKLPERVKPKAPVKKAARPPQYPPFVKSGLKAMGM